MVSDVVNIIMFGHFTNNCVCSKNMIQETIDKGSMKYEDKSTKVDTDHFHVQVSLVEPIMIVDNPDDVNPRHVRLEITIDTIEREILEVYRKSKESLLKYLTQKKESDEDVTLYPSYNAVFDRMITKTFNHSQAQA